MNEKHLNELEKLVKNAYTKDEVPVGAIIVKNDVIIGRGKNEQHQSGVIFRHAEINAIEDACRKQGKYELSGATIYITLEPCLMCLGAIIEARLSKIVYVLDSPKYGFSQFITRDEVVKKIMVEKTVDQPQLEKMMKEFFQSKR